MGFDISKKKAFVCDLDGTLFMGPNPIVPAVDFVIRNTKAGRFKYFYLTNNTSKCPEEYMKKIAGANIPVVPEQILTPLITLEAYIREKGYTSVYLFAAFWIINGFTQGMGFPPRAKMLTHWIHPNELATKMSVWNISHSFGAVMALGLCSLLLGLGFNWRWCFWVPAVLAGLASVFTFFCVKDSPTEAGVEELEIENRTVGVSPTAVSNAERRRLVFCNKVIWLVALANFFVYIVRFGFLDWGPTFLNQFKGIPVAKGGLMIIAFELAAVIGTVFAGWVSDKLFKGRGQRTCVFCMLFAALFSFGFWWLPNGAPIWQATLLLMGAGFCIYGPQALVGIVAANQATNEAAVMANGFTGIMGYASTIVSGIGIAFIKEHFGWGVTLASIAGFALVGMVLFLFAWKSSANDGYKKA